MYSFRDVDREDEGEDFKEELKKAYHEGMKDGIRYARRGGDMSFRSEDDDYRYGERGGYGDYSERGRDSYGRYR